MGTGLDESPRDSVLQRLRNDMAKKTKPKPKGGGMCMGCKKPKGKCSC